MIVLQQFATISALESDDQELNEKMINKQMEIFRNERSNINKVIQELSSEKRDNPLHLLDEKDVMNTIKHWIYNDINYEKYLIDTM